MASINNMDPTPQRYKPQVVNSKPMSSTRSLKSTQTHTCNSIRLSVKPCNTAIKDPKHSQRACLAKEMCRQEMDTNLELSDPMGVPKKRSFQISKKVYHSLSKGSTEISDLTGSC